MALIKGGGNGNRVSGQCVLYKMICRHPVGQEMYHRIWEESRRRNEKDSTVRECCDGSLSHPPTTIVSCNGLALTDWAKSAELQFALCYYFSPTSCITDHQQHPFKNLYMISSQPFRSIKVCTNRHLLLALV